MMTKEEIINLIRERLDISSLNKTQKSVLDFWDKSERDIIIYSPTGSGKTISFVIPIMLIVDADAKHIQSVIITPSRELTIQVFNVLKSISSETRVACCYGGHKSVDELNLLKSTPNIIVATPGRLLDHIKRGSIDLSLAKCLILDEFDKSLELGFSDEMRRIISYCPTCMRYILTSATIIKKMPDYIKLNDPLEINHLEEKFLSVEPRINMWIVRAQSRSKIKTLIDLLFSIPDEKTLIFSNSRETAQVIYESLKQESISVSLYHGGLEQKEREKAVSLFNNGTSLVVSATDLASRGLDIANIKHIIHFDLPISQEIFMHRNGRTARVNETGDIYLIMTDNDKLPDYSKKAKEYKPNSKRVFNKQSEIATIHISAGKKEKVSRGDIMGFIFRNTDIVESSDIGHIDVFDHYSLVAVPSNKINVIIKSVSPFKLKKQKVKLSVANVQLKFSRE